jgi:hypothetical protein
MGHCPAHDDANESFRVDARDNLCYCWTPGCPLHDERGQDQLDLFCKMNHVSQRMAIAILGTELGLQVRNDRDT